MKKNALFVTLLCGTILLFTQCKKEPMQGKMLGEIKLTDDELSYIPYNVNDSLKFEDDLGNFHTFWVCLKTKDFQKVLEHNNNLNSNYYITENLNLLFTDFYGSQQSINIKTQVRKEKTLVETQFRNPNLSTNDSAKVNILSYMNGTSFSTSSDIYHASLTVSGKTFNDVYQITNNYFPAHYNSIDRIKNIYFAKNIGIVAFETKNGRWWHLNN